MKGNYMPQAVQRRSRTVGSTAIALVLYAATAAVVHAAPPAPAGGLDFTAMTTPLQQLFNIIFQVGAVAIVGVAIYTIINRVMLVTSGRSTIGDVGGTILAMIMVIIVIGALIAFGQPLVAAITGA